MKKELILKIALSTVLATSLYSAESLDDVIVTAKTNSNSLDTAGTFTVITKKDIEESHATNVQDLLEESTGISLTTSGDGRKKVSVRGLDDTFTLILIDGKKVSNVDAQISYGDFAFEFISLDMIEKIEIGKGPMSTLYGSGAIGGVINIITKQPTKELSGSINVSGGAPSGEGGSETNFSANVSRKVTDDLSLGFTASKKKTAIIADKNNSTDTLFEGRDVQNIGVNAKYNLDETQTLSASFLKSSDTRDTVDQDSYYETDNKQYSLDYNKNFENVTLDLKAYRTETDTKTTFSNGFKHELVNDTISSEAKLDLLKDHFILAGLEAKQDTYERTTDDRTGIFDKKVKQYATYIQDDISLTDKTTLTLGARYDKHEDYDAEISPKAYLSYKLTKNSRIKGGYAEGFLAPTISQGTSEYQAIMKPGGPTLIFNGNSDLKAQTGKTYELAYEYDDNDLLFKSTLFYNDIKDFIDNKELSRGFVPGTGFVITHEYQNVSNAKTKGIEIEVAKKDIFLDDLNASIGYTYTDTENEDTNKELNMKPKHKINAKIDYLFPLAIKTTLKYELYGTQYNEDEDKDLGSYSLVDFGLSKKFSKNITMKAGIDNLFNKEIDNSDDAYNYQVRPRFYYVGLNYQF